VGLSAACSAILLRGATAGGDNRRMRSALSALLAGTFLTAATLAAPPAQAAGKWALNGTFTATSNGEWARTNDVFHDERSVRAIWTITSQCSYPTECTGTVTSDQGWTAPIYQTSGEWYVKHVVPRWMPCPDGTAADGYQVFRFKAMTPGGDYTDPTSNTLIGEDSTTGPGGACGRSLPLFIAMPFKLVKVG
jgi:hypothetical protein